ncbi:hypothetical protein B5M09_009467 [Aphanomyces astaci]|uniref:Uncharacterized protein n=1 Tax=Aphanomyces astaci TaxID=112090 RepID=A0A3R7Z838_APHAT|nr:hypothetical protein B5M09_009467 [Aphanomyces astaci]
MQIQARRDVQVLKADVDMLGDATFRDRHVQRLTDELACERNRVKALEIEMLDLRVKQADLAKGVLQKHSLFRVDRSICGQEAHASAAMSTDSFADEAPLLPSADDKVATPHSSLLPAVQSARHTFKVMANLDIKLSDMLSPPKKRSLSATARVTQAVVKLKAKLQHKTLVDNAPVPVELVELRRRMNVLYDRKRQLDEFAALATSHPRPGPSLTFAELVLGWFVAKYSTLQDAESEAKAFMAGLSRFRSVCGHVWLMEEFLHGKHPDEVVSFYLWVVQGVRDIHIGARCPITATDTHPQFICKFKASLLTRTIFRVLRFRTCGFGSTDRGTAVARDDTLEVMADCGRLFAAAAAGGPMYLGEFHAILDQFVTKGNGENDEMYPLDVYLYLLVLLFKKQNEWHVAHLVEQFRHHAADAHKEEMRRQAALLAAPKNRGSNPDNKPKKKKKASALSKGAMTKEVFGAFVAKLDLVRSLGDIQEVTALVVRSRREYDSGGITSDAFIAAAHANHWFALEFATRMSLRHELHDVTDDHDKATRQLASTWNLHLSRLTIHGECDKNVFVSRYVVQLRQRVTLALHDQKTLSHKSNPHTILALCRELLRFSWQLAVLRSHGNGFTKPDDDDDDATDVMSVSTLDMTRSSELILIAKGVCSLPAADGSYKPSDGSIDLEHGLDDLHPFTCIHMANVGDLFPHGTPTSMQSSESVELHRILQRYAWHVCEVYRSYSLVCNATTFGLTIAAFQELVHDLAIVTPHCTIVHLNAVYQHVVSSNIIIDNRTDQHTKLQTDDKVMNDTFVELLLRLAFQLNDDALFPPAMTLLVFNAVQDDVDERQCVFHEFTTAIVAIAQMKNNNPFLKWRRKADEFIGRLVDFAHANLHLMSTALFSRHLLTHVEGPQEAEGMLFRYVATLAISSGMTVCTCFTVFKWENVTRDAGHGTMFMVFFCWFIWSVCALVRTVVVYMNARLDTLDHAATRHVSFFTETFFNAISLWFVVAAYEFQRRALSPRTTRSHKQCLMWYMVVIGGVSVAMVVSLIVVECSAWTVAYFDHSVPMSAVLLTNLSWATWGLRCFSIVYAGAVAVWLNLRRDRLKLAGLPKALSQIVVFFCVLNTPFLVVDPLLDYDVIKASEVSGMRVLGLMRTLSYFGGIAMSFVMGFSVRGFDSFYHSRRSSVTSSHTFPPPSRRSSFFVLSE